MEKLSIGEKLYLLRKRHNENQRDLADALNVSEHTISRTENDITLPDSSLIVSICKYYKVSADWLLDIQNDEERRKK